MELVVGDVADLATWPDVIARLDSSVALDVLHLAAETGTGQSLSEPTRHALANVVGTTRLIEALNASEVRRDRRTIQSTNSGYRRQVSARRCAARLGGHQRHRARTRLASSL
ncbi:MAG: GDP-mannose 4,6-dehydratase [Burkholderiales bacterium]